MQDLTRLRYAAEHYQSLQGLRMVPIGIALGVNAWLQRPPGWDLAIALLPLAGAFAIAAALGVWYRNRYGFQRPRPGSSLVWVFVIPLFYLLQWLEVRYRLPISTVGLALAIGCAWVYHSSPRMRWYYGIAALVFFATSVLPVLGISSPEQLWGQYSRVGWTLVGGAMVICGILDHLLLRQLFSPAREGMSLEHSV